MKLTTVASVYNHDFYFPLGQPKLLSIADKILHNDITYMHIYKLQGVAVTKTQLHSILSVQMCNKLQLLSILIIENKGHARGRFNARMQINIRR